MRRKDAGADTDIPRHEIMIVWQAGSHGDVYRDGRDQHWLVSFLNYDLGFFDNENDRVEPAPNPFAPEKV